MQEGVTPQLGVGGLPDFQEYGSLLPWQSPQL